MTTTGIGRNAGNARFQSKYQEAYWFFRWVTRTPQEPGASPHKLSTVEDIRISVVQTWCPAAIFKYSNIEHNNEIICNKKDQTYAINTKPRVRFL